ncbi:MAG: hypothetical protein KF856_14640 [Cyclobacteriaceae bacterium]|nr:hypothetical protein [Cyclobacteriaceae bacterium]
MKFIIPFILIALADFSSCQDDAVLPAEAKAKLLAGNPGSRKTWKLINETIQVNGLDKTYFTGLFNYWSMPFPTEVVSLTKTDFKIRMVLDDGDTII